MSSTPISLPTNVNRLHKPSFDLPSLPEELRMMIWKAATLPRIVPLMVKVETPECKHMLRRVLSNAIVTTRCEGRHATKKTPFSIPPHPAANNPCTFPDIPEDEELDRIIHAARTSIIHDWRYKPRFAWESNLPPPPLLHVCKESRFFALKHYTLSFATKHSSPTTYFNFQLDTLYFTQGEIAPRDAPTYLKCFQRGSWPLFGCIPTAEQLQVRSLAIDTRILKLWEGSTPRLQRTLSQIQNTYRNSKLLSVVVADFTHLYDGRRPNHYSRADSLTFLPEDNIPLKLYSYTNPHWHKNHPAGETTEPFDIRSVTRPQTNDDTESDLDRTLYSTSGKGIYSTESASSPLLPSGWLGGKEVA